MLSEQQEETPEEAAAEEDSDVGACFERTVFDCFGLDDNEISAPSQL